MMNNSSNTYTPSTTPHGNNHNHSISNNDMVFLPTVYVITLTLIFYICIKILLCIQNPTPNV